MNPPAHRVVLLRILSTHLVKISCGLDLLNELGVDETFRSRARNVGSRPGEQIHHRFDDLDIRVGLGGQVLAMLLVYRVQKLAVFTRDVFF